MSEFVKTSEAAEILGIHPNTLRRYAEEGKIEFRREGSGNRLYNIKSFREKPNQKQNIIYICGKNEEEKQLLIQQFPNHKVIFDSIKSDDWQREGIQTILESAMQRNIGEIVVSDKEQISDIGFELFESIIKKTGGRIVVLNNKNGKSRERELTEELFSIITKLKYYGKSDDNESQKN